MATLVTCIEHIAIIITYMTDKTSLINTGQLLSFLDIGMFNYMNLIGWNWGGGEVQVGGYGTVV